MALLNYEFSELSNFIAIRSYLTKSESIIMTCTGYLNKTIIKYANGPDEGVQHSLEDLNNGKLGNLIEKIKRYEKIVKTLITHVAELTELMQYCVQHIEYYTAQYLIKQLTILGLKVKKLVLIIRKRISELLRKILKAMLSGKAAGVFAAMYMAIIAEIQLIGTLLTAALKAIETLLDLIPGPIAVKPAAMALFPTPKSWKKVDMVAINTNKSICDRLPEPIKVAIREAVKMVDKLNVPIKLAIIAACAASGMQQATSKTRDLKIIGCRRLSLLDPMKIVKAVELLVSLLPIPQGLPKYEKLHILNLGYDAWLITSWCPAGKKSFGIPGQL